MVEKEEPSAQCGTYWWNWRDLTEEQKQRIEGLWPWCWTLRRHSSERAFLWSGPGRRTSASQGRYCGCCAVISSTGEASAVRRMRGGTAPDHHGHLARVEVELFAFTHRSAGCVERSHKNLPVPEAEFFFFFLMTLRPWSRAEIRMSMEWQKKVMKKFNKEVGEKRSQAFSH